MRFIEKTEKVFEDVVYNKSSENEMAGSTIENTWYKKCIFDGFTFSQVKFSNVRFEKCRFLNSNFSDCKNLISEEIMFLDCELINCTFTTCNCPGTCINSCNMEMCSFSDCYLRGISIRGTILNNIRFLNNCNLMDCRIDNIKRYMEIQFINDKTFVKLNYGSNVGNFDYSEVHSGKYQMDNNRYINISNTYMDFAKQFEINNIPRKYGDCFYKCRKAMHFTFKGKERAVSHLYDIVCGYGERPERSFLLSLFLIVFFAVVHSVIGINTSDGILSIATVIKTHSYVNLFKLTVRAIYFSTVTFATVGYGDFLPVGIAGEIAAVFEILSGIIMVGIWTSTLVRKITR